MNFGECDYSTWWCPALSDVDNIVDFMDTVSFLPTSYKHTILNLEQKGLMSVQKKDVKAVEALWSVMQPMANQHPDWRIVNYSFADFEHRLDLVIVSSPTNFQQKSTVIVYPFSLSSTATMEAKFQRSLQWCRS